MIEERDLYDINRNLTGGKICKHEKIPNNSYIIVVTLFIENNIGKILLQKRSKLKGGKYGFVSGHPKSGETSIQGMIKEVEEEIGLKLEEEEISFLHTENVENSFFDFYYLKKQIDLSMIVLQKEEVEKVEWFSREEIKKLIENGEFYEKHIAAFDILNNYI